MKAQTLLIALSLTSAMLASALARQERTSAIPAAETVQDMLAAQVRLQGLACEKALRARKDARHSKADHEVWVLKCSNAVYGVSRAPDMAAEIKRLR